ncbi:permease [Desulfocucumis palustris]|uniref:Permease n=1 Tax=Desulfocucumis palustris TaxID=1898651 RepID=A0A2L2XH56_9FIRM|nr:DMT family transporter [Desulfocucumis palustris]GBF33556.1 permease [Desulfocucumis palustris]
MFQVEEALNIRENKGDILMAGNKLRQVKADLSLVGVTAVWGFSFVAVQDALSGIGPYYFLAIRFLLAAIFLAAIYYRRLSGINRSNLAAGAYIGAFLFGGYAFQTVGLQYTGAANSGFITGLAVVLVPLFAAIGLKRIPSVYTTLGVLSAAAGLGLLAINDSFTINYGDTLTFFCAVCYALHIIMVGRYASKMDPVLLAIIQIGTVSAMSFIFGMFLETMPGEFTRPVWVALLITAIPATALAFLIQNKVQRFTSTTHTAIIFTMEPIFAALSAFVLADELLSVRQLLGCFLILAGMLAAELKGGEKAEEEPAAREAAGA